MANEARVFAEGPQQAIVRQFTVADGTALTKGALMVTTGATRTVVLHTAADTRPAGFLTMQKEASDGTVEVGLQRTGVVEAYIDGVVTAGDLVYASVVTANRVQAMTGTISRYQDMARLVGRAIESGTDGTRIKIALTLG